MAVDLWNMLKCPNKQAVNETLTKMTITLRYPQIQRAQTIIFQIENEKDYFFEINPLN